MRRKVGDAGLFDLMSAAGGGDLPADLPDVQSYEITVSDGGRTNTVVLGEANLTPELRELLTWLRAVPGHREATGY